jgi:hypothetical protein
MTPRNRSRIALLTLALANLSLAQVPNPLFEDAERLAIMNYWASPGRYLADAPADAAKKGVWQVRLTPAGSIWLWNLTKGKKIPPTQVATAQPLWEAWIAAKVRHDRWEALKTARAANLDVLGQELPAPDANTPLEEPPLPGVIPADLQDALGSAPNFAEAVAPLQHKIAFDDITLTYQDNVRMGPRYAYYRFANGVQSMGVAVKTMPPEALDGLFHHAGIDEGCARVMRAVSILEGGFDSVNTYDTGFVSVGFIQFASLKEGAGSLGAVLRNYKSSDPLQFASDFHRFGVEVDEAGHLVVVDPTSGSIAVGSEANARIIEDKRLIAVFGRAGKQSEGFCAAQVRAAKAIYWPSEDMVTVTLNGMPTPVRVGDLISSEAGLATLFDRKVNTGRIDALGDAASRIAAAQGLTTVAELAKYEKAIVAMVRYRKDYLAEPNLSQPAEPPMPVKLALRKGAKVSTTLASRSGKTAPGASRGHRRKPKTKKPS